MLQETKAGKFIGLVLCMEKIACKLQPTTVATRTAEVCSAHPLTSSESSWLGVHHSQVIDQETDS